MSDSSGIVISSRAVYLARIFYGVTVPLFTLATATFGFRIWKIKAQAGLNNASDICMAIGFILAITDWALLMPQMFLTSGPKPSEFTLNATKYSFLAIPIWGLSMAMIKTSIGLTLLQIQKANWFRILIWSSIIVACLYGIVNVFFILFECHPLPAAWGDYSGGGPNCSPYSAIQTASYVGCGVSMITDIILSLAPISFLWNMNRPFRERLLVGVLMALGITAACSSLAKNLIISSPSTDLWAGTIAICTWTSMEQILGIIAANAPFCKPVLQSCLQVVGVSITSAIKTNSYGQSQHQASRTTFSKKVHTRKPRIYASDEDPLAIEMRDAGQEY